MNLQTLIALGLKIADKAIEIYKKRQAKQAAQDKWANTPSAVRGCPKCKEIAFTPGQVTCTKCGSLL